MSKGSILVVDDEKSILAAVSGVLEDEGYEVKKANSGEEAIRMVQSELPDLVLLDIWMPGMDGLDALVALKGFAPELGVIMISGHGTVETAVKALQLGAMNFIEKPLSLPKLVIEVQKSFDQKALERENRSLKQIVNRHFQMIGSGRAMGDLKRTIAMAGPSNARVLISGESGTGKELVAREIHNLSNRSKGPFIEVNCAAIPEELIESELFGHEKGAFTSATYQKKGKFELAHGGTMFLDEIGDMSLKTQAKVLRVLENSKIERVGGSRSIAVDARIIAASNKDLKSEITNGRFREDLFYRLNVIPVHIPPLREHPEDILELVQHYIHLFSYEYGKVVKKISDEAIKAFQSYSWPGNIRELRNEIERLVIMTQGTIIKARDLGVERLQAAIQPKNDVQDDAGGDLKSEREAFERNLILKRLEECRWNITMTAESLGIERSHLHRKMKSLGITTVSGEGENDAEPLEEPYE